MTFRKVFILPVVAIALLASAAAPAFAQDPLTKLGRGAANTLTGWVEITKNVHEVSEEENPFAGLTTGLARGIGKAVVRTGVGIWDALTFPFPSPENYDSPIDPEYVF